MKTLLHTLFFGILLYSSTAQAQSNALHLRPISTTKLEGGFDEGAAEISSYNEGSKRLFVVNGSTNKIDVFNIANPVAPVLLFSIDISTIGGGANSVVTFDNYVAVAIEAFVKQDNGSVAIFDIDGNLLNVLEVGALPDMIGISHDHTKLVTANEGEPSIDYAVDPAGSVSIINIATDVASLTQDDVVNFTFENYNHIRQSFELQNDNWGFAPVPMMYDEAGASIWGPVSSLGGRNAIHGESFWGIQNLNAANVEGGVHTVTFDFAELTGRPEGTLRLRYFTNGLEADDVFGVKVLTQVGQAWEDLPLISLNEVTNGWAEYELSLEGNGGFAAIQIVASTNDADDIAGIEWAHIDFLHEDVRIFGNDRLSEVNQDLEPEYAAFSADDNQVVVTLQENNAFALIDLSTMELTGIQPLGFKDHSLAENGFDASNTDGIINITAWPVRGMYQPDAIASFESNGETYYITANEGDVREYDTYAEPGRISSLTLDAEAFPAGAILKSNANLGRLNVTKSKGDYDFDGDFEELFAFGARSFTIWNSAGEKVYDSGNALEQITAALDPAHFNSTNDDNTSFDNRSDDKGPEPEGIATGVIYGKNYAFIGLERIGGVMVFDITDPNAPVFVTYENNRGWDAGEETLESLDMGPEGLLFIPRSISPNERDLVVVSNEISGTVTIFQVDVDLVAQGEIELETFDLSGTELIGTVNGLDIHEAGVSGMYHVPGTTNEFYVVGDRGPNADANNHPLAVGETKVFVFPDYAPKMHRMVANDGNLSFVQTTAIKNPNGDELSGRPLPVGAGNSGELPLDPFNNILNTDEWGLDSEGIVLGNDGYFWVCDEYGANILKLDMNGQVVNRYTPFPTQAEDIQIDPMVGMRRPNRGFEGIAWTPNGKIYAILQSPANNPDVATGNNSRLHRMMELDPFTGEWRTFLYAHKPQIGQIRERDWKIGDLVAINNNEFLLLEHAERNGWNYKNVIKISLEGATALTQEDYNGLTPEQLLNVETAITNGIQPIEGELYLDLLEAGWDTNLDKPEGLTIIDNTTIAVINDNDYGIISPNADGQIESNNRPTTLFMYHLPEAMSLDYQDPYCTIEPLSYIQCDEEVNTINAPEGYELVEWSNGEIAQSIEVSESVQLNVRLTNAEQCAAYTTADITINPLPSITAVEPMVLCADEVELVIISENVLNTTWSNGDEGNAVLIDATEYSFGLNELVITFENEFGCVNTSNTSVEVVDFPVSTLAPFIEVCDGDFAVLATGNEMDAHVWSTEATTNSIEVTQEGEYFVTVTNEAGCQTTSSTYVNVAALPVVSLGPDQEICEGESTVLFVGDYNEVLWSTGETTSSIEISEPGTYSVAIQDIKGCEATDDVVVTTEICVGLQELKGDIGFTTYPNPVVESLEIGNQKGETMYIELFDLSGKLMMRTLPSSNRTHTLRMSGYSAGMYILKIYGEDRVVSRKIEKI